MSNDSHHTKRVILVMLALSRLLGPIAGLALPSPVAGSPATSLELTPRAYLPFVTCPEDPPVPELAVYDQYGTLQDWDWLVGRFGDVTLDRGTGTASVVEIREIQGTSTLVLWLENSNGDPIVGQDVVFYWPDAPELDPERQACGLSRGIIGSTKENGEVGFGMGVDSQYDPEAGEIGAHQVWVVTDGTDCLRGLGMLFDNHIHLDSVWRLP